MKSTIKLLLKYIPRKYLIKGSVILSAIFSVFLAGNKYHCPICEGNFRKLLPYGLKKRENVLCPRCLSLERHRLIWLFLKNETQLFKKNLKLLHIAPEQCFYKKFRGLKSIDYISADLESPLAKIKMNIHNIPCENDQFDVIICNHVLEHVKNDIKAIKEIHRVLKPGGWALLQSPIDKNRIKTFEDSIITAPQEREKKFGQKDHVRIYGMDYPERLKSSGFKIKIYNNYGHHYNNLKIKYCLPKNEDIYQCFKS